MMMIIMKENKSTVKTEDKQVLKLMRAQNSYKISQYRPVKSNFSDQTPLCIISTCNVYI